MSFKLESYLRNNKDFGKMWLINLNIGKTQPVSFNGSNSCGAIDVNNWWFWYWLKLFLKFWDCFSLYNACENCSLQIGTFVYYWKLLSTQVVLDLYKFAIWCWMEYCSHFWFDFLKWDLHMLEKLQKEVWRVVSLTLPISLPVLQVLLWSGYDD